MGFLGQVSEIPRPSRRYRGCYVEKVDPKLPDCNTGGEGELSLGEVNTLAPGTF
jgi:hypothetical protein